MSVTYLLQAADDRDSAKLIRFVRLHLGDGNEESGRKEIDKSWVEALKILLRREASDEEFIAEVMTRDDATLALLYFSLHLHLVRKSGEWVHDGSR